MLSMENIIIIMFVILVVNYFITNKTKKRTEGFDAHTSEFVPFGCERYGLRGDLLRRSSRDRLFIRPDRNIVLNQTSGQMWTSNVAPHEEGMLGCNKIQCPVYGDYGKDDTCWQCGNPSDNIEYTPHKYYCGTCN